MIYFYIYLICNFVIFFQNTICSVEKYLKTAENKSHIHKIRNIDFIYMINLDERPEKFSRSLEALKPYNITPYRFSAVNGWKLNLETINELGIKYSKGMMQGVMGNFFVADQNGNPQHQSELISVHGKNYFCHGMTKGAIGIVLSHLSILQDALNSGYEIIWVMEDDIEIHSDPRKVSDIIDELDRTVGKNNWDILFTDKDTRDKNGKYVPAYGMAKRPNFNPADKSQYMTRKSIGNFIQIGARFGAYSMIVKKSGMQKILNFIKAHKIFFPYDFDNYLAPGIKMFTVKNDVVGSLLNALSDNGAPYYQNKQ